MHLEPVSWQVEKVKVTENDQAKNLIKLARRECMCQVKKLKENHTADHYHCTADDKQLDQ